MSIFDLQVAARKGHSILISRTDSIGDVILTLPLCGWLKAHFPGLRILFLGSAYTRPVLECCQHVDAVWDVQDFLAQPPAEQKRRLASESCIGAVHVFPQREVARTLSRVGLPFLLGTRSRWYHWLYCTQRVALSRRHSPRHEAQLNIDLLRDYLPPWPDPKTFDDLPASDWAALYGLVPPPFQPAWTAALPQGRPIWVLHPTSKGSAREYPLPLWLELARRLSETHTVWISGLASDRPYLLPLLDELEGKKADDGVGPYVDGVVDGVGRFSLGEFIAFLSGVSGIVAGSTGPLHIGAALGIGAVGLYPPVRPVHPGRWAPLGAGAVALSSKPECDNCTPQNGTCPCMKAIKTEQIVAAIHKLS